MDDIAGIEARLAAALDRIARGVEGIPGHGSAVAAGELADTQAALEAEKAAHGELAERVKAIRERQEQTVATLEKRVQSLQGRLSEQEAELGRFKRANAALRDTVAALRTAAAEGNVDAALVNGALEAELEATRAAQAADRAELDAILSELKPLIEERADV